MHTLASIELGIPGALISSADPQLASSKVGGLAWVPSPHTSASTESLRCKACSGELALLLQVHAPQAPGCLRTVYLFACPSHHCKGGQASYRAFSCQPHAPEPTSQQEQATAPPLRSKQPSLPMHDEWNTDADWGTGGGNWGEDAAQQPSASSFDMSDLQELLNSVSLAAGAAPAPAHKTEAHRRSQPAADLAVSCVETPQQFPQFFLCFESEPLRATVKDSESIQKLVDQYQASEAAEGTGAVPKESAAAAIESWTAEQYEADATPSAPTSYLKFMKRLRRQPDQCVRYGLQGALLWPGRTAPLPPPCAACSGHTVFEMQVMPQLMHALSEAEAMMADAGQCGNQPCVPDCWDWTTIAVFTCPECSLAAGHGSFVEHPVLVAQE